MTQFAPSPSNPYVPHPTRTRVRWDNLAVLCAALAVVGGVATTIMSQTGSKAKPTPQLAPANVAPAPVDPTVVDPDASTTSITAATLEDATALVDEARGFIAQGRWEEAADRLASVDPNLRPATEAAAAQLELRTAQASWNRLDGLLRDQVAAKSWAAASVTLDELAKLAPLAEDQLVLQDQVDDALAPAVVAKPAAAAATATKPAAAATAAVAVATAAATTARPVATTGGGATAAKPAAAATPKPVATTPKPAAAKPATPKPAAGATTTSVGGINITMPAGAGSDVSAAELEQLLGSVLNG